MDDTHKSNCHETQYLFPGNHSGSRSLWKRCNSAVLCNLAYPNAPKISMYDRLGQNLTGHHVSLGDVFSTGPDHGTKCCQEGLNVIRPASLHYHGCMVNVETYHFKHITFQHGIQRSRFVDKRSSDLLCDFLCWLSCLGIQRHTGVYIHAPIHAWISDEQSPSSL